MSRTPGQLDGAIDDVAQVLSALPLGITTFQPDQETRTSAGLEWDLTATLADGSIVLFEVKTYATVTPPTAHRLIARPGSRDVVNIVVADQITPAAGDELSQAGWSWLDRRGRIRLHAPGIYVDTVIQPLEERLDDNGRRALETDVGLDVATAILTQPDTKRSVRDLVAHTGRSLGAVHAAVRGLTAEGLLDGGGRPLRQELFWETSARWRPQRVALAEMPRPMDARRTDQLHLGLDDIPGTAGWAIGDLLAANVYGAPAPVRGDHPPDFYVPDGRIVRVARRLYGDATTSEGRACTVAVPPAAWICRRRVDPASLERNSSWVDYGLVHPLIAALDLSTDAARGREILNDWTPPDPYQRVW